MARPRMTTDGYQTVTIRVPKSIMDRCQEEAQRNERSLNFTIVAILRQWYTPGMQGSVFRQTKSAYLGTLCESEPVSHQYEQSGQSVRQRKDDQCRLCALAAKQAAQRRA